MPTPEQLELAHAILITAYHASEVVGMGRFQAIPNATPEQILRGAYIEEAEGAIKVSSDYVLGRMMKLSYKVHPDLTVESGGLVPRTDYQSWCHKYPTVDSLVRAAKLRIVAWEGGPVRVRDML